MVSHLNNCLVFLFLTALMTPVSAQPPSPVLGILLSESQSSGCFWIPDKQDSTNLDIGKNLIGIKAVESGKNRSSTIVEFLLEKRNSVPCTVSEGIALDGLSYQLKAKECDLGSRSFYFILADTVLIPKFDFRYCTSREGLHFYVENENLKWFGASTFI